MAPHSLGLFCFVFPFVLLHGDISPGARTNLWSPNPAAGQLEPKGSSPARLAQAPLPTGTQAGRGCPAWSPGEALLEGGCSHEPCSLCDKSSHKSSESLRLKSVNYPGSPQSWG